jgi:hypothetical protein
VLLKTDFVSVQYDSVIEFPVMPGIWELGLGMTTDESVSMDLFMICLRAKAPSLTAILNIEALDLVESSTSSSGVGKELSNNCEDFVGIDGHSRSVEGLVANTVRIEITSIRIASTAISCTPN